MKKFIALLLVIVLSMTIAVGGTLAYLQSTSGQKNTMTVGNVNIEQLEYQRTDGTAANATYNGSNLETFEQNQPIYPAVPANATTDYTAAQDKNDCFKWGNLVTADVAEGSEAWNGLWNTDNLVNAMDKMVFVKNTGSSDCYYRTIIALECPEGMEYSSNSDKDFMFNYNSNTLFKWEKIGYYTVNGTRYLVEVATYQNVLKPGMVSRPSLLQVVMTHHATSEDAAKLGATYEILALSQAVQAAGFKDAATALNTSFGELNEANLVSWLSTLN